jgi:hypothetical protein
VYYNLTLPPRRDSLSVFSTAIRAGHSLSFAVVPAGVLLVLLFALWKLPRTAAGFALGSAWLLAVFNLLNKQSFFNEWSFVLGLILLAVVVMSVEASCEQAVPSAGPGAAAGARAAPADPLRPPRQRRG